MNFQLVDKINTSIKPEIVTEENVAPSLKENQPEVVKGVTSVVEPQKEETSQTEIKKEDSEGKFF